MVIDFSSFYEFPRQMDRLLEEFQRPYALNQRRMAYPPLQLSEDEANIYVRAEVPGVKMDDIELTLTSKSLVIRGERTAEKGKYYRQERPVGAFQRIVTVGVPIDREKVSATLTDGHLNVTLPKHEASRPRRIEINAH